MASSTHKSGTQHGATNEAKECFVICPIGDPGTEVRRRSDQVLKHIIDPAIIPLGYASLRADKIAEPGMITSQVIQHIVDSPLVIADLTDRNPNVYYELAVRHAIRKPLIQLIKKGEALPFDVAGTRTIHFDHQDLDSVDEARGEISKQIEALQRRPSDVETPISVSLDLQNLRQSENPEERSLGDILAMMTELRVQVAGIEKRLSDPNVMVPPSLIRDMRSSKREQMMFRELMHRLLSFESKINSVDSKSTEHDRKELLDLIRQLRFMMEQL